MFILCKTIESVEQAVHVLADAEYVFLDCEGSDFGLSSGALSLISLGTPHAAQVYLFDVLALPRNALQLLFNSVFSLTPSAREKTKVVWDGRMDYVELFYGYTCPIENVLDLQLVDVISRAKRGETENTRLYRFARHAFPVSEIRKLQLQGVYALNSMDNALVEHKLNQAGLKNNSVKRLHTDGLTSIWMQRPLSSELLDYAASDIVRIAKLYDHFSQCDYLEPMDLLCDLSSQYVSIHHQTGKLDPDNIFLKGPLLPLSISLDIKPPGKDPAPESRERCSGCRRMIPKRHFPFEVAERRKKEVVEKDDACRHSTCKVCTFILAKKEYVEKRKAERARKAESLRVQMGL